MKKKFLLFITLFFIIFTYPKAENIINYDWSFDKTNNNYGLGLNNVLIVNNNYFTWHIDKYSYINVINKYNESGNLVSSYEPNISNHIIDLINYDNTFIAIDKTGTIYKLDDNFKVTKEISSPEKNLIINDKSELKISNNIIYYIDKTNLNIYSTDYSLDNYNLISIEDLTSIEEILPKVPFLSLTDQMYFKYLFSLKENDENTLITDIIKKDNNYYISTYSDSNNSSSIRLVDESLKLLWLDKFYETIPLKISLTENYIFLLTESTSKETKDYQIKTYDTNHKFISSEKLNLTNPNISPISIKTNENGLIIKSISLETQNSLSFTLGDKYDEIIIDKYNYNIYNIRTIIKGEGMIEVKDNAIYNEIVPFKIIAKEGYVLEKLIIKDSEGNSIPVSDYTIKIPNSNVTITAIFTAKNPNTKDNIFNIIPIFIISLGILILTIYQYKRCKN